MTTLLLLITFVFWSAVIIKNGLFWIYLWQVKEYRFDRVKVHFELTSSRKLVFSRQNLFLLLLLLASFTPFTIPVILVAAAYYGFFASRAFQHLQNNSLKAPKFTFRAILVTATVLFVYGAGTTAIFVWSFDNILIWFVAADLVVPVVVFASVLATQPFFTFLKNRIIKRAIKKREKMKDLLVIGITGSYGKTSMKELLSDILSKKFKVLKTPENINVDIGVARVILKQLKEDHEVFIVEMGAYKKGEIEKTAKVAKPQISILTGINMQHVSLFGNLANTQQAKYELVEALPDKGLALFNGDDENTRALFRQCKNPKRLYATNTLVDKSPQSVMLNHIKVSPEGLELKVAEEGKEIVLKTPLLGKHNATNIMGAVTLARELRVEWRHIKEALEETQARTRMLQLKKGIKESIIIDDTYSANENGVLAALDVLNRMKGRRKICVIQPLIELGPSAEKVHRSIAASIAQVCDFCIVTGRDFYSAMCQEAMDNGMSKDAIFCLPNPHDALRKTQELTDKGDIILLENRIPERIVEGVIVHKNK
ncbi:MAG: UDP-N-acetylmuramoyl-tripeptide--D-alanyl-D-alanine ligase [Candidatus Spechtbacterales bacterium]